MGERKKVSETEETVLQNRNEANAHETCEERYGGLAAAAKWGAKTNEFESSENRAAKIFSFDARNGLSKQSSEAAEDGVDAWNAIEIAGRAGDEGRLTAKAERELRQKIAEPGSCDFVPRRRTRNGWLATGRMTRDSSGPVETMKRGSRTGEKRMGATCGAGMCG